MADNDTWLLTADIALCYGWSVAYVRKLAYQHRWRRIRVGQGVAYSTDDVDAYYQQCVRRASEPVPPERRTNPYRNRAS